MATTRKRNFYESYEVSEFCEYFTGLLSRAGMQTSRLYSFLIAKHEAESLDDLVSQFKAIEDVSDLEVLLFELAIISRTVVTVELITKLNALYSDHDHFKEMMTYVEAAKYDVYTAVQANDSGYAFTLIHQMETQGVGGLKDLLETVQSCVPEEAHDSLLLYCHLFRYVRSLGAANSVIGEFKRKRVEGNALQEHAVSVLENLGCDAALINELMPTLIAHPVRLHKLNTIFNTILITAVDEQPEKQKLIEHLIQVDNVPMTMRQRFNLLSDKCRAKIYPTITQSLTPIEKLLFDVECEVDYKRVVVPIKKNKHLFVTGEAIGDCCRVVDKRFTQEVLSLFLDKDRDDKRIMTTLGALDEDIVKTYLKHITPTWMSAGFHRYACLIRMTAVYSDLEKWLLLNMQNMYRQQARALLNYFYRAYGEYYAIYVLNLLSEELVCDFLCNDYSLYKIKNQKMLREFFRVVLSKYKVIDDTDMDILEVLSVLRYYNDWIRYKKHEFRDEFHKALNHYLLHLPDRLKAAIVDGIQQQISGIHTIDFLNALACKKVYLTSYIHLIASNFELTDILGLCEHIVEARIVLDAYENDLAEKDIETLSALIKNKQVERKTVKACVLRCYAAYQRDMNRYNFKDTPFRIFLILLHQYAPEEFDKIVKNNFKRFYCLNSGHMNAVNCFPEETRMRVLRMTPRMCPADQLGGLLSTPTFTKKYKDQIYQYFMRTLKQAETRVRASYFAYLQAVYHLDEACFLDYCSELSTLGKLTVAEVVGIGMDQVSRVNIMLAICTLMTPRDYTTIVNNGLILFSFGIMSDLLAKNLKPAVAELARTALCDMQLAHLAKHSLARNEDNHRVDEIVPMLAVQLGVLVSLLPAELQLACVKRSQYLVSTMVDRDFVLACCHDSVKPEVRQLFQSPVKEENRILTSSLNKIKNTKDMLHRVSLLHRSSRFEFLLECRRRFGNVLYTEERDHAINFLKTILQLLPVHYQRFYVGYYLHLADTKERALSIAAIFATKEEQADIMAQWEKLQQAHLRPAQRGVKFVLFRPAVAKDGDEEEPRRKMARTRE